MYTTEIKMEMEKELKKTTTETCILLNVGTKQLLFL